MAHVSRAEVDVGDKVTLSCNVQFGGPRNTSRRFTAAQFPTVTMTLNDLELTQATYRYIDGQPAQQPHTIIRVCTALRPLYVHQCYFSFGFF